MISIDEIIIKAREYKSDLDEKRIREAYAYAEEVYKGSYRLSGHEYTIHLLSVVDILLDFRPDEDAIIATLLHNIFTTPNYNPEEIKEKFGDEVAKLVSALVMLDKVRTLDQNTDIESLRKMFLAMAKDLRVVFIKLSDRLHNMMTLEYVAQEKHKLIAKETLDIYVPISARFGIYNMKGKLEDLSFKYLYPKQYEELRSDLEEYIMNMGTTIEDIKLELARFLKENGVDAKVNGRIKNLFSIYKKLKLKNRTSIQDIYDVFAIRAILNSKVGPSGKELNDHLYAALGLIHSKWTPLTNRFKDYVAVPKPNGYKSLHTTVMGLSPFSAQPTEIQIRSMKMHEEAEFGVASHWFYKDYKQAVEEETAGVYEEWVNKLSGIQKDNKAGDDLLEALKLDVFTDRIFVLTPTGEVKDLPKGSTPVDFAYAVHSDVGNHAKLAKVDDKVVPLDYQLHNGEVVEIMTHDKVEPKPHWLSFVRSAGAKNKIRAFFRSHDKDQYFREGKDIVNKYLEKRKQQQLDDDLSIFRAVNGKKLSLKERIELVEKIGTKSVPASTVIRKLLGSDPKSEKPGRERKGSLLPRRDITGDERLKDVYIAGEKGLPYKFAACCKPAVGHPIVGYVTRGQTITIHTEGCKILRSAIADRILVANWGDPKDKKSYSIKVKIVADDRVGLMRDMAEVVSENDVSIINFSLDDRADDGTLNISLILEISDDEQFKKATEKLAQVRNIRSVLKDTSKVLSKQ
ncbi:RelA/SpoT family protein [Pseudomonadota bacterium]